MAQVEITKKEERAIKAVIFIRVIEYLPTTFWQASFIRIRAIIIMDLLAENSAMWAFDKVAVFDCPDDSIIHSRESLKAMRFVLPNVSQCKRMMPC